MRRIAFTVIASSVASGTGVKTIAQVVAATGKPLYVTKIEVSIRGTAATDPKVPVSVNHTDGAGTSTSATPQKLDQAESVSLAATAGTNFTVEPGSKVKFDLAAIHPQGNYVFAPAPGHPPWPVRAGKGLAVQSDGVATGQNVDVTFHCEEWVEIA